MSAKYKSPSFLLPNELNTSANTANDTGINSLYSIDFPASVVDPITIGGLTTTLKVLNTVTVSFWYYPTNLGGGDYMINTGTTTSNGIFAIERFESAIRARWKNSANTLQFIRTAPTSGVGSALDAINKWYHICIVFDTTNSTGTDKVQIWINGVRNTTGDTSLTGDGFTSSPASNDLILNDVSQKANKIDELAFFNKALTSTEIAALYDGTGSNIRPSNLMAANLNPVAYYPLGEQAQNTGYLDPNNPGNDIAGSEWQFPNGVLQDYVMDFDGTDQIDAGIISSLNNASEFTISTWVKLNDLTNNYRIFGNRESSSPYKGLGVETGSLSNAGKLFFYSMSNNGAYPSVGITMSNEGVTANNWFLLTCKYKNSTQEIFINGSSTTVTSGSKTSNVASTTDTTTANFLIGADSISSSGKLNGELSNFQIFNTGIDSTGSNSIQTIYNNGSPLTDMSGFTSLTNWWKLNATSVYTPSAPNYTTSLNLPQPLSASNYIDFPAGGSGWSFNDGAGNDTPFTVSAWVYNTSSSSKYRLLTKNNGGNGYEWEMSAGGANTSGSIEIYLYDSTGSGTYIGSKATLHKPNEWVHVAFTYDASAVATGIKIYANGEQLTDTDVTVGSYTSMGIKTSKPNIGRTATTVGSEGNVSNLTIFNSELTTSQISTLFNFGTPETTPSFSPTLWFKLDNTTTGIQSAGSLTGASYNGTIGGSVTATSPAGVAVVPSWKIPSALTIPTINYTSALEFNQPSPNNEYVDIGNIAYLNQAANNFTISQWVFSSSTKPYTYNGISIKLGSGFLYLANQSGVGLRWEYEFRGGSSQKATTGVAVPEDKWIHIALTVEGTVSKLYQDGNLKHTGVVGTTFSNSGNNSRIGQSFSSNFAWNGKISNTALFNSALSPSNITTLYNNGQPEATPSFSPLHWWKLDNTSTGLNDVGSAASNNGTLAQTSAPGAEEVATNVYIGSIPVNGVSTTLPSTALQQSDLQFDSPYSNYSLSFDGSTNLLTCDNSSSILNVPNASMSVWVKPTSSSNGYIYENTSQASGYSSFAILYLGSPKTASILLRVNGNNIQHNSSNALTLNEWNHVAFSYDGTALNIYVNGVVTTPTLSHTGNIDGYSTSVPVYIGRKQSASSTFFNGYLDEMSLFNYGISSAQLLEIYNNGKPGNLSNYSGTAPISWWRLGENAYFDNNAITVPNSITGAPNGVGPGTVVNMLSADAPGTYANGIGTNLDILDRVGDAPLSVANSQSYNMIPDDKTPYVPRYVGNQISNTHEMAFDASSPDYIVLSNFTSGFTLGANANNGFTVSVWVNITNVTSLNWYLLGAGKNSNGPFTLEGSGPNVRFSMIDGSASAYTLNTSDTPLAGRANEWIHLVYAWDGTASATERMKIYIDGVQNTSASITGPTSLQNSGSFVNSDTHIGAYRILTPGTNVDMMMDEMAIFTTALTADQIKFDLYKPSLPLGSSKTADIANNPNLPTPLAWYRMGD